MSQYLKRTTGKTVCFAAAIAAVFVGFSSNGLAQKTPSPASGDGTSIGPPVSLDFKDHALYIGPVEGLTTGWHWAPPQTPIPLGITVRFKQSAPPDATVLWTGAKELSRDETGSIAECPLTSTGEQVVRAQVSRPNGQNWRNRAILDVVDISIEDIHVGSIAAWVEPVELDENSTNEETMYYFFRSEAISTLRDLGDGHYRTSVRRRVQMSVEVDPPAFAPLIEWRIDGEAWRLGGSIGRSFNEAAVHSVSAGPPDNAQEIEVETYAVTITSHTGGVDVVPEGEPITFEAVTDPPGYEQEITWLSSTKYGTAVPVLGEGPTFTVQFDDTWGSDGFQWLGVRADNTVLNQDQKDVCAGLIDLGLIEAETGLTIQGDTTFASNDFTDCGITPPCDHYGGESPDQIYRFSVDTDGIWVMDTCAGADFDSSIQVRREVDGEGCPGTLCMAQDDDCCGGVCGPELMGTAHDDMRGWMVLYVIVDGYSVEDSGPYTLNISFLGLPCEGDANFDGVVDALDSAYVLARFGCPVDTDDPSCDSADQNGDGVVDPLDAGFVLAHFGLCE